MTMQLTPSRNPLAETVMVKDWAMRRLDQRELPESSLAGLGAARHTGTPAQRQWKVNPLGAMRHTGTKAQRTWTVNPLGETVMVKDWAMRRLDQRELPESSLAELGYDPRMWTGVRARSGRLMTPQERRLLATIAGVRARTVASRFSSAADAMRTIYAVAEGQPPSAAWQTTMQLYILADEALQQFPDSAQLGLIRAQTWNLLMGDSVSAALPYLRALAARGRTPATAAISETVMVKDWAMRRLDQRELPESSLMGLGAMRHTGTPAQRRWGINRLGETVYVNDTASRRYGMTPPDGLLGFGAFGANAQMTVRVDDIQRAARRLGICNGPSGRLLRIDNNLGPETRAVLQELAQRFTPQLADPISGDEANGVDHVMIDSELWTAVTTAASNPTAIDTCGTAARTSSGGGSTIDTGTHTTDAPPDDLMTEEEPSMFSNPWYWVAAAAVVGVVGFAYYQSQQSDDGQIIEESWETISPTF